MMVSSIPHLLDETSRRYPDREAVRFKRDRLTYAQLQQRANRLAALLQRQGVERGDRVGLYMKKSLESVVALYAIMKAGAAYVPLDPFMPVTRLVHILNDCEIQCLISEESQRINLEAVAGEIRLTTVIGVEGLADTAVQTISWPAAAAETAQIPPEHTSGPDDLAYILYTSGSTGVPKGVAHTQASALTFALWAAAEYGLTPADRLSNHAPFHFDLSTFDLYAAAVGATVVIIPEYLTKFPASLAKWIAQEKISVWYSVPYALMQMMDHGRLAEQDLCSLRWILFAGEIFPLKHLRALMRQLTAVNFSNLYGPTETNVCTYYHVESVPDETVTAIPVGYACPSVDMLVVDKADRPVAEGEIGELLVAGGTVMRGYWNRPALNEQVFLPYPEPDGEPVRYYRTGDLVRQGTAGEHHYMGRKDRQIKTRGYRVELDEVEAAMLSAAQVQEAVVFPIADGNGSQLIAGAFVPKAGYTIMAEDVVNEIAAKLPAYALPVRLERMVAFPRTATGKIDRRGVATAVQQRS